MHSAFLYVPGERLSLTELSAARLDGDVFEVGDCYMHTDAIEDDVIRAQSISVLVPRGFAACGPTAAWIHGAGDAAPLRHHVQRAVPKRVRVGPSTPRLTVHESALESEDWIDLGGVAVTTPLRTVCDLARQCSQDSSLHRWLSDLVAMHPSLVKEASAALSARQRLPGKRAALLVLSALASGQADNTNDPDVVGLSRSLGSRNYEDVTR